MAVRPGTGMVVKYFKEGGDLPMTKVMAEVDHLTDKDLIELVAGITDGSLNY
jgi:hypothetical protein